jgi:hypothetical protein
MWAVSSLITRHRLAAGVEEISIRSSGFGIHLAILTQVVVGAGFTHLT